MNAKKVSSLILYILFIAVMAVCAYVLAFIDMSLGVRIGVGTGVFVVAAVLALIFDSAAVSVIALMLIAGGWGMMCSTMFAELGEPDVLEIVLVCGVYAAAFLIFCLLANIPFFKEHHVLCMVIYGLIVAAGAVAYAVVLQDIAGWFALIMFLPYTVFYMGLVADAENFADHAKNNVLIPAVVVLFALIIILHFILPSGGLDLPQFGTDTDDPYTYDS